jgi:hypothetical protein
MLQFSEILHLVKIEKNSTVERQITSFSINCRNSKLKIYICLQEARHSLRLREVHEDLQKKIKDTGTDNIETKNVYSNSEK